MQAPTCQAAARRVSLTPIATLFYKIRRIYVSYCQDD